MFYILKDIFKLIVLTIFFSLVVFFIKTTFFTNNNILIEEKYIEPSIEIKTDKLRAIKLIDILKKKKENNLNSAKKYYFVYIPTTLKNNIITYKNNIKTYINNENLLKTIEELRINFYKDSKDRRGKMKNKTVKIFNPEKMGESETLNIFIHEFAHYIDLYYLKNKLGKDLSNNFYNISWVTTKTLKPGQAKSDFVSGYAMTNKYEDFAESLTYFVIANNDFRKKTEKSENLKKKYLYIQKNIFKDDFFKDTKFTDNLIIKDYYRDITKMKLNLKNFLQYFKK